MCAHMLMHQHTRTLVCTHSHPCSLPPILSHLYMDPLASRPQPIHMHTQRAATDTCWCIHVHICTHNPTPPHNRARTCSHTPLGG